MSSPFAIENTTKHAIIITQFFGCACDNWIFFISVYLFSPPPYASEPRIRHPRLSHTVCVHRLTTPMTHMHFFSSHTDSMLRIFSVA